MSKESIIKQLLLNVIDGLDSGTSQIPDDETANEIIDQLNRLTNTQTKYSKYQACKYLHVSRATFDNWVRDGKLPKGRKEQGFTELFWTLEDLNKAKEYKKTRPK